MRSMADDTIPPHRSQNSHAISDRGATISNIMATAPEGRVPSGHSQSPHDPRLGHYRAVKPELTGPRCARMSTRTGPGDGVCILSFDSGGPGTYSQLLILKEYMNRLAYETGISEDDVYPADYFDLMGGAGFGGLVALVLGYLRMNVNEAINTLLDIASAVLGPERACDLELNTNNLKKAIESILKAKSICLDAKIRDANRPPNRCRVALFAATSARINHPHVFRTYSSRGSSSNPTIVEALCASIATPSHFAPVKIGPRPRQQNFIGGAVGANNPTRELLTEASDIFGKDRRVAQILSIGSGLPGVLSLTSSTSGTELMNKLATDCETVAQELHTRLYKIPAYLRLNVDRGLETVKMEDWSELGDLESHTEAYIAMPSVSESFGSSLRNLKERIGSVTFGKLNQSGGIKKVAKSAPSVSPHFVPREKPWNLMVHHLVTSTSLRQKIFPVTGMGGCGKTQMVSYFLQEYPSLYTRTVFLDSSSASTIQSDLQAWVQALGDGHERDTWEDAIRILTSVSPNERWLLILDNADDPMLDLVPFIPKSVNVTVIVTSRNRDLGNLSTTYHLELGEMEAGEALGALLQAARRELPLSSEEMKSARTLTKELGYLALAVVQVGTYCRQLSSRHQGTPNAYTFTQYLSLFYTHRRTLMKEAQPSPLDNYKRGVYTTLDLSYQALQHMDREFLHFISFFHYVDIPLSALATAANCNFTDKYTYLPRPEDHRKVVSDLRTLLCFEGRWSELQVQRTIRTLQSFSLLSASSVNGSMFVQLHPLIQAWSRDMVPSTQHYRAMVIQCISSCSGDEDFVVYRYVLPHILDILDEIGTQDLHVNDLVAVGIILQARGQYLKAAELTETALERTGNEVGRDTIATMNMTSWLGEIYERGGKFDAAEKLEVKVLEHNRKMLGTDHPNTTMAAANLAWTYRSQGRWTDAETLQQEVLEQRRRILGMEHPHTIMAAGNLASTYHSQGRWTDAETLEQEVLEQRRRILGMEHPDTITAAGNLASTYHSQGRWTDAETLEQEVLEQRRRILGMEHPDTIGAAENLAWTYRSQGRWTDAETLQQEVLEQRRRILGMEHPDTIMAAGSLASTYHSQGRWTDAETLEQEVLEQRRRILGMEHPDTIMAAGNLASTYHSQGRWTDAETLQQEVLEQRRRILGMEHPDTIMAAANLASTYHSQGRWTDAETLQQEVLEQRRRILGMEHPNMIRAAANLACTYDSQGRWADAETLEQEVLEQRRRILGMEHPDTIMAAANLASTYHSQGRWTDAETLQQEVLEQRRRILGMEHPDTIMAAANLASTYHSQGRWTDAETLQQEVLEQRRRILGMEHPHTIMAAGKLASTYHSQGRWTDAETLEQEVLEQCRRILGMEHPHTIMAAANLACTYRSQGRWTDAETLDQEVLEQRRRILGMEHPDTIGAAANLASTYRDQGRWTDAETLEQEVLEQRRRILGMEHPDTILAMGNLAVTYGNQNRWEESIKLLASAVKLSLKVCGQRHPHTQRRISELAFVYEQLGNERQVQETRSLLLP